MNIPQYINPKWDFKQKEKATKEHGGEASPTYRVFVRGEVIEDGLAVLDMVRVRKCYDDEKVIKHFEITKENYDNFKTLLILDRPANAEMLFCSADIGETAPSELTIISKITNGDSVLYKYLYNITLYNLTDKEQYEIFKWIAETMEINIISLDCTEGQGRAIFRSLEAVFPRENLVWVGYNEKISIGVAKSEAGYPMYKDGKPVYEEEYVSEWSVKRLKDLFYDGKMYCPLDYKLDMQLNSLISTQSGARTVYSVVSDEDHLLSSLRCFAIAEWQHEFSIMKTMKRKKFSKG